MISTTSDELIHVLRRKRGIKLTSWLQGSTSDEETIDIWLGGQILAVLVGDRSTVDDASLLSNLGVDLLLQPLANSLVDLLCLGGGGNLSGSNSPDWLVGNDDLLPLLWGDDLGDSGKLGGDDLDGLTPLALLEGLSAAENDVDVLSKSSLGLGGDKLVGLANDDTALRVADQGPVDVGVLELGSGDLSSESSLILVVNVRGGDSDLWLGHRAGKSQVQCWWSNDNLYCKR